MKIAYCLCGSFCTLARGIKELEKLASAGHEIIPVMSQCAYETDTRFGSAHMFRERIVSAAGRDIIHTIAGAEPIGPVMKPELTIISPCTGNTLAKLANGITDTPVTMAANDALGANLANIAIMRNRKSIHFVPMAMDDPENKPHSLVADFGRLGEVIEKL